MRRASGAYRETVQIVSELGLHRLHGGHACEDDAEVGFHGRPKGVEGGDVAGVVGVFVLDHGDDAKGSDDAGADGRLVDSG